MDGPKLSVSIFLLLTCVCSGVAQQILQGKIVDKANNQPIAGATVYIPDLKKGAVSDIDGFYKLEHLPKGKFLVQFKFVGYSPEVRSIDLAGITTFDIELSTTATELNEIVVTGISQSSELRINPVSVVAIDAQSLLENTSSNIIDNISKQAGVNQITTGTAIAKPVIRGLSFNRIVTLYDGIRQEGQQWGDEHGIEIDEFSVERVEIIKGAGSLMYGSDALGGVVNFLAPDPVERGVVKSKWISNFQTNNGLFANSIHNSGNIEGVYWHARFSNKMARPYSNEFDGKVFNSGFKEYDFNGFVGVNRAWGYSQLSFSSFNQSVGLVEGERNQNGEFEYSYNKNGVEEVSTATESDLNSYRLFIPNQSINHTRLSTINSLYLKSSRLQFNVAYQNNKRKEFGNVIDENEKTLFFDLTTANYNVGLFLPEKGGRQISFGTAGMVQFNRNKGREFLIPEYNLMDWGIYGFARQSFNDLSLAGGIRYDLRTIGIDALYLDDAGNPSNADDGNEKFQASSPSYSNLTASLGVSQQIKKSLTLKANISRGFRAPNLAELASNGRHEGSFRYEIGNHDLKAEHSLQIDAGVLLNADHVTAEVSWFTNNIDNYIYLEKMAAKDGTDSIPDPGDPAPAYQYVQGHAILNGGEILLDLHPHPFDWLHFENSFSFVNAINKSRDNIDSAKYLPFIPSPKFQSELRASLKKIGKIFSNAFFKIEYNYFWKQDRVLLENGTETPTPSYSLWNAGMGSEIVNKRNKVLFSIYITANNVFDAAYQNHLSRLKYAPENPSTGRVGVFNSGRNFSFKLIVPIEFKRKVKES
jgi:iron complex outermembrane receptor protein